MALRKQTIECTKKIPNNPESSSKDSLVQILHVVLQWNFAQNQNIFGQWKHTKKSQTNAHQTGIHFRNTCVGKVQSGRPNGMFEREKETCLVFFETMQKNQQIWFLLSENKTVQMNNQIWLWAPNYPSCFIFFLNTFAKQNSELYCQETRWWDLFRQLQFCNSGQGRYAVCVKAKTINAEQAMLSPQQSLLWVSHNFFVGIEDKNLID